MKKNIFKEHSFKHLMPYVLSEWSHKEYENKAEFDDYIEEMGFDGLEIIRCDDDSNNFVDVGKIEAVHLLFFSFWLEFYRGNQKEIDRIYGDENGLMEYYGSTNFDDVMARYQQDLEYAQSVGAKYVVFHVTEVEIEEALQVENYHTDEEVVDAAVQIINKLLDGKDYDFYFLCENLWHSGLNFLNPATTHRLISKINYEKKGLILDTGHLICTNTDLKTEEEACDYIMDIVERHRNFEPNLADYIYGVHLQCSLTGEYMKDLFAKNIKVKSEFHERYCDSFGYFNTIDPHKPWTSKKVLEMIDHIAPKWVTHEVEFNSRKTREWGLEIQTNIFREDV